MTRISTRVVRLTATGALIGFALSGAAAGSTPADQLDRRIQAVATAPNGPVPDQIDRLRAANPDQLGTSSIGRAVTSARGPDGGRDGRVAIGVRLDLMNGTGSFVACCAVNDHGPASVEITSFVPHDDRDEATFEATNTFMGSKGSITVRLRGTTGPLSSENHIANARWRVVKGTGDYANLSGGGTLKALTDQTTGALTGIDVGTVRGSNTLGEDGDLK